MNEDIPCSLFNERKGPGTLLVRLYKDNAKSLPQSAQVTPFQQKILWDENYFTVNQLNFAVVKFHGLQISLYFGHFNFISHFGSSHAQDLS